MTAWETRLAAQVRELLRDEVTGHDYYHALRVCKLAARIARQEGADPDVVIACAYLHDINRARDGEEHGASAAACAPGILERCGFPGAKIRLVAECIRCHEWTPGSPALEAGDLSRELGKEFLAFIDADRLDALGAIGIARTFAFGAATKRPLWLPEGEAPAAGGPACSVAHLREKLLKLRDGMHTATALRMAERRHRFVERFLCELDLDRQGEE